MEQGKVKFYNEEKGYGFISNGNQDIFVHVTGLLDEIKTSDDVSYDIKEDRRGPKAINVRKC